MKMSDTNDAVQSVRIIVLYSNGPDFTVLFYFCQKDDNDKIDSLQKVRKDFFEINKGL